MRRRDSGGKAKGSSLYEMKLDAGFSTPGVPLAAPVSYR